MKKAQIATLALALVWRSIIYFFFSLAIAVVVKSIVYVPISVCRFAVILFFVKLLFNFHIGIRINNE